MAHDPNLCPRIGCPRCDPEMRAIVRDSHAGRFDLVAERMDAITLRTLRAHGAKPSHPAYRALRSRKVPSPTIEDLTSSVASSQRDRQSDTSDSRRGQLMALLSASQPRPTSRVATAPRRTGGMVPSAPDLIAAIRAARTE
jgi:hypothetical protein